MAEVDLPVMLRVLSSAVSVASRAGSEIRRIAKTGSLGVVDKGIRDYQTEADRLAQRMIVASLSKQFPKCHIVGEEDLIVDDAADALLVVKNSDESILKMKLPSEYQDVREEDLTIWVDPLDGTTDFVKGDLDHVTVLIGISLNGKSVAGVINQPFYGFSSDCKDVSNFEGRTVWGLIGLGCFGLTPKVLSNDELIVTTTSSHGNRDIDQSIAALNPTQVIKAGGAGYKVLLVIEGEAHSYVFTSDGCKRWDTSAPEAVLISAGGQLTDSLGRQIVYNFDQDKDYRNRSGIIASNNQKIHSKIVNSIPEDVKKNLSRAML